MKLTQKKQLATQKALVFGAPFSGKSKFVGKLAEVFNLLWIDLEKGHTVLFSLPEEAQARIEIIDIPDTKMFPIAIETILKIIKGAEVFICELHGKVSCQLCKKAEAATVRVCLDEIQGDTIVVIDSLTQLSNSAMNHLLKGQDDLYRPEWGDYRNQGALLETFLSQVQQAKYNIVCITHEIETQLEDGKTKLVPLCGTTTFSRNTAKYFDHCIYVEVKNKDHKFASSTTYSNMVLTGSRLDIAIETKKEATLLDIFTGKKEITTQAPAQPNLILKKPAPLIPTKDIEEVVQAIEVKSQADIVRGKLSSLLKR